MTPLIAVAHGSRDPRSARVVAAAVSALRVRRPDLDVRLCFLDLNAPSVDQVIDAVAAEGHASAVVVPLLLGSAFHARVDLPALLDAARLRHPHLHVRQADVLGHDARLVDAVRERIVEAGGPLGESGLGVVLAAVGSSDPAANGRTRGLAESVVAGTRWSGGVTCFATAAEPTVRQAISTLRRTGAERIVIAPWFLAPGLLTDRLSRAAESCGPGITYAATIGPHPRLLDVILDRYSHTRVELQRDRALSA
ncbi:MULTISPECIES: sirohydrochlorin chelatase [unclassified Rhodococcus (in: high G+C Gram-positive bacteria)]|uniref:sirohydrochlorin chelatase n=1 Tax=unclassified Rhodococcus (in: high G+C Gram-positive bacteria) TaxID=192944 RepID=UPI00163A153F|nr:MULTISPECIES: sirohydrochlorin chelatase [unclassified Rhodococcus (in: high G+C Gram-positive bacteria)]MBC2638704.1 sirohydrochlorin chelatase [Rhodococcus sp. 3A]MBC2896555.1 sirohydrochlorin chelatase [Rhodococcus sp. 4CII]